MNDVGIKEEYNITRDKRNILLCKRIKDNDIDAKKDLVNENMGLIVSIAKNICGNRNDDNELRGVVELEDLIHEGVASLLDAVKTYDEEKNVRFVTYAYEVIRNSMLDYVKRVEKSYETHMLDAGYTRVFLDDDPIDDPRDPERIRVSEKYGDGERDPIGDKAVYNLKIEKLGNRILDLSPRMQALIIYYYGIMTNESKTYKETAGHFHLTKTYARYMIKKALKELKDGMNDGKIV